MIACDDCVVTGSWEKDDSTHQQRSSEPWKARKRHCHQSDAIRQKFYRLKILNIVQFTCCSNEACWQLRKCSSSGDRVFSSNEICWLRKQRERQQQLLKVWKFRSSSSWPYFSVKFTWESSDSDENLAESIAEQQVLKLITVRHSVYSFLTKLQILLKQILLNKTIGEILLAKSSREILWNFKISVGAIA